MSNSLKHPALPWLALLTFAGGLAAAAGCGGDGTKDFGGHDTGGAHGATGGNTGSGSGGNIGPGTGGATATGGMSASGGTPGSGGDAATGSGGRAGAPGTGGAGAAATGGRPATGGMSGTGATGSGASGGYGGTGAITGSGGRPGTGGTPGTGGSTAMCEGIAADYQGEMPNARMCNTITGLTVPQCQMMAAASLGCGSSCTVYVQDNAKLTEIQKRWNAMNCQSIIRVCPAVTCVEPKPGYCYASTGSVTAQCQSGPKN